MIDTRGGAVLSFASRPRLRRLARTPLRRQSVRGGDRPADGPGCGSPRRRATGSPSCRSPAPHPDSCAAIPPAASPTRWRSTRVSGRVFVACPAPRRGRGHHSSTVCEFGVPRGPDCDPAAPQSAPHASSAPPGPFRPGFWRSPLRGSWLTAFLGSILLVLFLLVFLTGLVSHAAYQPDLGSNFTFPRHGDIGPLISLPQGAPAWLYAVHPGPAHHHRPGGDPGAAGQAVVGDPAPVRLAARGEPGAGARAAGRPAAGRRAPCSSSPPAC